MWMQVGRHQEELGAVVECERIKALEQSSTHGIEHLDQLHADSACGSSSVMQSAEVVQVLEQLAECRQHQRQCRVGAPAKHVRRFLELGQRLSKASEQDRGKLTSTSAS